ncbi:MAG TPA: hypothetical protein VL173_01325 [Vicinamibacterales bacterium]|nr:hypothetical protein [Vicinamibacterales bacterium]
MLFFEFFPAVVALVSLIVGWRLVAANRRARRDPGSEKPRAPSRPAVSLEQQVETSARVRRPSMSP